MPTYYPMMVDLAGRRCLVVGGGRVAERKIALLLDCGAAVDVVSPAVTPRISALARRKRVRVSHRPARASDVAGAFLVFAATDDAEVNRYLAERVRRRGGLVNVADSPSDCAFLVPSVVRQGDLTIAVSTSGSSPALAKRLRERLETTIGPEYRAFLGALRDLRARAQQTISDSAARHALYRRAVDSDLFERAASGNRAAIAACIARLVRDACGERGQVSKGRAKDKR